MRNNQPVTNREVEVLDDQAIVSKTDLNGNITYVNPYFTQISGFSEDELLGAPQNLVRHPDMPAEAFADLWSSIQSGTPWTGIVKNRCKNGDHYWVRANITPIRENGKTIGYMSVRVKAERHQIAKAEQAYRTIRTEAHHRIRIKNGQVIEPGFGTMVSRLSHVSLGFRIWAATSIVNVLQVIVCGATLMNGSSANNYGIFAATFLGLIINVFLWYTLRVSVLQPLNRALHGARAIAAGDLSGSFDTEATDEVGQLLRALQQMNSNLIATIRDVRVNVETMAVATRQIAAGNADLSGRTEAQAASLEETASSVEQFSSTVKQNADNSEQANKLAQNASDVAVQGGVIVADVIATMDEINSSSRKIVDIIGLIEGIAFQTNILALNAAVEAARAGEQGRGFAVVAGEVRNLAQRSATAAKDIKNLIDVSVGKVSAGMVQVDRAGATMKEVVASVQQVTAIMREISVASHEQSIGVDQVNSAIAHMDQVTQQNAALVEEAAAATASLALEAGGLTQAVSLFKFGPARSARAVRAATNQKSSSTVKRLAA
ncbi:PAS domain-containing protein [Pseudoduganella sp. FT25W]|jgi:aerotaxis receptor|uniref:PAS domain-containing protein n=1 Tax=Duganella alba TaxID=2666081 RepID=A0A6L5QPN2_9BURK|nr:PAS domain-containing methyl-accepting chemotaxis protein [Duganella alba]MRX11635.1 PAS domain-containing protein [Duganella alba]MRX19871.1 PAS domain-containing protein [Duganella alba]